MSDRQFTETEVNEAIVRVYNGALMAHAEGTINHEECMGAKSGLIALMEMLEIEYRFEPADGRAQQAVIEHVPDEPTFKPKPDTEGPAPSTGSKL